MKKAGIIFILIVLIATGATKAHAFWGIADVSFTEIVANSDPGWIEFMSHQNSVNSTTAGEQTDDTVNSNKQVAESAWREGLRQAGMAALKMMTKLTVNWINSGFEGNPLYVENLIQLAGQVADTQVKYLVDSIGYPSSSAQFPYAKSALRLLVKGYAYAKNDVQHRGGASQDLDTTAFDNSFYAGGWNGWLKRADNAADSALGTYVYTAKELGSKVLSEQNQQVKDLDWGNGYFSYKKCTKRKPPRELSADEVSSGVTQNPNDEPCLQYQSMTPGKEVGEQVSKSLSSGKTSAELSAAVGSSISEIFDALLNQLFEQGLRGIATLASAQQQPDSWSYEGLSLTNPDQPTTTQPTPATWDLGPDRTIDLATVLGPAGTDGEAIARVKQELQFTQQAYDGLVGLPAKAFALDMCVPGPDKNWQLRLTTLYANTKSLLQTIQAGAAGNRADFAGQALQAIDGDQNTVSQQIGAAPANQNIPDATVMSVLIQKIDIYKNKKTHLQSRINELQGLLSQLLSMKAQYLADSNAVSTITAQYISIEPKISTETSVSAAQVEANNILSDSNSFDVYTTQCQNERAQMTLSFAGPINGAQQTVPVFGTQTITINAWTDATAITPTSFDLSKTRGQMLSDLKNVYSASTQAQNALVGMSSDDLRIVYSLVNQNSSTNQLGSVTGNDLVVAAINKLFDIPLGIYAPQKSLDGEKLYYCFQYVDSADTGVNTAHEYDKYGIGITCDNFYHSTVADYSLD